MICLDTTFLIDLWRNRQMPDHPAVVLLAGAGAETMAVAAHAAGEFLEGAAWISGERLRDALAFLGLFRVLPAGLETAAHYARIVADLRGRDMLRGLSKPDMWIAASAVEYGAALATRNGKHFESVPDLRVIAY